MTSLIFVDTVDGARLDSSDQVQEIEAMNNSYPAEIERLMEQKGYVKQRGTGVSVNALAREAGVHVDTVTAILRGGRSSRPRNVEAVAAALGISSSDLLEAVGSDGGEVYVGPAVTRHMTDRERAALTEFLLATMDRQGKAGEGNAERAPSNTQAGDDSPAHDDELAARRTPHRRRRAGHDPEWDQLYGRREAAHDGIPGEEIGQDHTDSP